VLKNSNLYELYFWPDDSSSDRGAKYLAETISYFKQLQDSNLILRKLLEKDEWSILEICAGAGYGSLVFSSLFPDKKIKVLVTDTRDLLMESARLSATLGVSGSVFKVCDALNIKRFNQKFDVVIMYGLSTPHFSPKESIKLYSSVKDVLTTDGMFIIQEMDRRKAIFLDGNYYKKAYAEGYGERLISEEKGYDIGTGMIEREYYSESNQLEKVTSKSFFWSVAETDALLSFYWDMVDKVSLGGDKYFLISHTS